MQRRCYWLLEGNDNVVLVHYLSSNPQENCVMRGPPPNGGALSLNAIDATLPAPQVPALATVSLQLNSDDNVSHGLQQSHVELRSL